MRAVTEMDGDGRGRIELVIAAGLAAVSPYVQFLYVPFVWILENIGVTAAWNNATRILGRTTSSNREHPANGATADEAATKGKFQQKILLMLTNCLITLAFAVPFGVMSTNDGRMTQLSEELMVIIALGIVFLCLVIILLLFFWDMRCLRTATFICIMGTLLFLGLAVLATLAALHLI